MHETHVKRDSLFCKCHTPVRRWGRTCPALPQSAQEASLACTHFRPFLRPGKTVDHNADPVDPILSSKTIKSKTMPSLRQKSAAQHRVHAGSCHNSGYEVLDNRARPICPSPPPPSHLSSLLRKARPRRPGHNYLQYGKPFSCFGPWQDLNMVTCTRTEECSWQPGLQTPSGSPSPAPSSPEGPHRTRTQ